jgi:D-alanyl-D-alanine-carboxypeptidase/D-alanyl-D-alanine-endopeptidase
MKQLFGLVALGIFACGIQPVYAQSSAAVTPPPASPQTILDARTKSLPGSGIVAAVIDHGVVTTYISGSSGNARPLDDQTLFEIGSITKTFTATVLAEMVLAGKVRLSDPVSMYVPSSVRVPSRDGKAITLLTLATQHSGLPRMPSNMGDASGAQPYENYSIQKLYTFLNGYRLTRDPGASFEYSNLGFGLLGYALARNAHTTYEDLVRKNVLVPLGMDETRVTANEADAARLSVGHNVDGDAVESWKFTDAFAGAGAIRSDLADMIKYLRCNLGVGPLAQACLYAQEPRSTFPGHRIGLAWWTNDASGFINHGGDTAGYHALVLMNRDRNKGVVLLSSGPSVTDIGAHLLDSQYPVSGTPKALLLTDASLSEYAGTYANASIGLTYTVAPRDGKLYARLAQQDPAVIYPSSPDHFYYRIVSAYVEFVRQSGTIVGIILTQNAKHLQLYRIGADGKPMASTLTAMYPPVVHLEPQILASYAGTYAVNKQPAFTVTVKDGHVFLQVSGQRAYEMFPSARDELYFKVADARVSFHRDESGGVTSLTLHQDGDDIEAARIP